MKKGKMKKVIVGALSALMLTASGFTAVMAEPTSETDEGTVASEIVTQQVTASEVSSLVEQKITATGSGTDIVTLEGKMPESAYATAAPVQVEIEGQVVLAAYDITIYDAEGNEYQPADGAIKVQIEAPAVQEAVSAGEDIAVYHMEDVNSTPEQITEQASATEANTGVEFEAENFSVYAIAKAPSGGWGDQQECDISYYNSSARIYWDTMTYNSSSKSGSANHSAYSNIKSVVLHDTAVTNANSGSRYWSNGIIASQYFPNATTKKDQEVELVITPEEGYYVTTVVVACTGGQGNSSPYDCNTWSDGGAFTANFSYTGSGATTVSVSAEDFSHRSHSSNYFILIVVAPVPSPLYVEYDYGDIVTNIGAGSHTAFDTASGWTSANTNNDYGTGEIQTNNTQYKYAYADGLSDAQKAAAAAAWKHTTNTITDVALEQAAAAGYYFDGWAFTYYGTVVVTGLTGSYNNYNYAFSESTGGGSIGSGEALTLQTNVKLVAQWKPITLNIVKNVKIDGADAEQITSGFTMQMKSGSDDYGDSFTLVDGGTKAFEKVPAGTYSVSETDPSSSVDVGGTTYYFSGVEYSGDVTLGKDTHSGTITVTNNYTSTPPTRTLKITKVVTGGMGDKNKEFTFSVSGSKDGSSVELTGKKDGEDIDCSSFTLKNTESVEISVPNGAQVVITENNAGATGTSSAYSTTFEVADGGISGKQSDYTYTISSLTKDTSVTVTNNKDATIDVGFFDDTTPYFVIIGLVAAECIAMFIGIKCRKAE